MRYLYMAVLITSLLTNVYFLMGKGIDVTYNYQQDQHQHQAQLILTPFSSAGQLTWDEVRPRDILGFLRNLPPEQALMAKVADGKVLFPRIEPEKTKIIEVKAPAK